MTHGRSYIDFLRDMLEYAAKAERLVADVPLHVFQVDEATSLAVVRCLEIIGEAARSIPVSVRKAYPEVPWRRIVGMRNVVAHHYFGWNSK